MKDYIFLIGAQGVGKTTIARLLKDILISPHIDFDWIRDFHLNKEWGNYSDKEWEMSLENLTFILKNYKKHHFHNVITSGFTEKDIGELIEVFKEDNFVIITLYLTDDNELKNRVLNESRDSGFRDYESSIKFNKKLRYEVNYLSEYKINNTYQTPEETVEKIVELLSE